MAHGYRAWLATGRKGLHQSHRRVRRPEGPALADEGAAISQWRDTQLP